MTLRPAPAACCTMPPMNCNACGKPLGAEATLPQTRGSGIYLAGCAPEHVLHDLSEQALRYLARCSPELDLYEADERRSQF